MSFELYRGKIVERSVVQINGASFGLGIAGDGQRQLVVAGADDGFVGTAEQGGVLVCPLSPANARELRRRLAWLRPMPLGHRRSFGFGDRLGNATPGHIAAMRSAGAVERIAPLFAQQSVRENARTGRTPQQVMDDAMWGVFEAGWREPWGADADHVKEIADLDAFVAAGYTFYTIDPSDHVDNAAQSDSLPVLREKIARLPWDALGTTYEALAKRYGSEPHMVGGIRLVFDEATLLRALAKYGRAIAHTHAVAAALAVRVGGRFDLEMSVDETDTPTSVFEHFLVANELLSRELPVVSLAPRFVGKFQKGVDYMGDRDLFQSELKRHVAIMRHFDRYKLSVHTGSDKFSIYPLVAAEAGRQVHVKTAGTSYLEALRVVAAFDAALFRRMLDDARAHFEHDRKSYFLDAQLDKVPAGEQLDDNQLPVLLDQFDARQVLHVAFGTLLTRYGEPIRTTLARHQDHYRAGLERHFVRHLAPFVS